MEEKLKFTTCVTKRELDYLRGTEFFSRSLFECTLKSQVEENIIALEIFYKKNDNSLVVPYVIRTLQMATYLSREKAFAVLPERDAAK